MIKVAAVLFVKNESEDISWWISWHLSLGFSDIIIYDDYSGDGTWEIINSAAKVTNVTCLRAIQSDWFNHRQKLTYLDAIDRFRDNFDWMIFIDSDEYVSLKKHKNISDFLSQYPDANAVAINWCCYGSNKNVLKPCSPNVFENYTRHSYPDYEYNYTVKSFFRPKFTKTVYINPHRFEVEGRYVTTDNKDIIWQDVNPERTVSLAQWDVAQISHFLIRSTEHYIEKIRRRSDIRGSGMGIGLFNYCDRNDILNNDFNVKYFKEIYTGVFLIQHQLSCDLYQNISDNRMSLIRNLQGLLDAVFEKSKLIRFFKINTTHGTYIRRINETGQLCHDFEDNVDTENVICFSISMLPNVIFISSNDDKSRLFTFGEARVSTVLSYIVDDLSNKKISLQNPLTKQFLCAQEGDLPGDILSNRGKVDLWESYTLQEIDNVFLEVDWIKLFLDSLCHLGTKDPIDIKFLNNRIIDAISSYFMTLDNKLFYGNEERSRIMELSWLPKQIPLNN